ncbi:MAG: nitrite reductase small subunit NirD [Gammaproteobacteria bacterium]|nr:nitrite reductase small subunit NirD [Gammaproteobacteria bacterium]
MNDWLKVVSINEIPRLGSRVVSTDTMDVAIFRSNDDRVFALKDACPHRGGPLSQGIVHGSSVTCPLHNWKIDLQTGQAIGPDEGCTRVFATRIENDMVYLKLSPDEVSV